MNFDHHATQMSPPRRLPALAHGPEARQQAGGQAEHDAEPGADQAMPADALPALLSERLGHQLRSPLSAILMSAEVLKRKPDAVLRSTGARLVRSAEWMRRMVQDMQDVTRCQLGHSLALQLAACDMEALLRRIVDDRGLAFPQHRIGCTLNGPLQGEWDTGRLHQLLWGLLGNALHHGDASQPVSIVADGSSAAAVQVRLHNGGGIAAPLLARVFEPLQADTRRSAGPEGLGFGLYIARQIARAHGGELTLQSGDDSGTLVTVTLPRSSARAAAAATV